MAKRICTTIPGVGIDATVSEILLEKVTPMAVDAAISVQQEIIKRAQEADQLLRRQVERAQYDADLARRRLMSVAPENRLVAANPRTGMERKARLTRTSQARL